MTSLSGRSRNCGFTRALARYLLAISLLTAFAFAASWAVDKVEERGYTYHTTGK